MLLRPGGEKERLGGRGRGRGARDRATSSSESADAEARRQSRERGESCPDPKWFALEKHGGQRRVKSDGMVVMRRG